METEERPDIALNYSKEDLELLVNEAEKLVLTRALTKYEHSSEEWSSDSDYETRASREWLVRSEPNISLGQRSAVTSTPPEGGNPHRRRPKRPVARPHDWRHSLPECLEYYQPQEDGRESAASLPLSDLWEHELVADFEDQDDKEKALPATLTDFGEDYSKYLYSEIETDSDIFSDEEDGNDPAPPPRLSCLSRHGVLSHKTQQSQTTLKNLLIQANSNHDSWKCQKELVSN